MQANPVPKNMTEAFNAGRDMMLESFSSTLKKTIENPSLDLLTPKMVLQVLLASLQSFADEVQPDEETA